MRLIATGQRFEMRKQFKININEDGSGKAKRQFENEINSAVNLKLSDLTVYRLERF